MSLKIGINLTRYYSINFDTPKRNRSLIKFVIIHYTGMRKESEAIKKLCDIKSKVSAHYFIKKNGEVLNLVPDLYTAWHAGKSRWKKFRSLNKYSIGIEISNPGHEHGYRKFNENQIKTLIKISKRIIKKYKINKKNILGHSDIAPLRKKDPGEKFPWKSLHKNKIGIWHNLNSNNIKNLRGKISGFYLDNFSNFLKRIGYRIEYSNSRQLKRLTKIFQTRFRPELINGKCDLECYEIAKSLKNIK